MNGLLLIDKPAGWTSFDVVNKVRSTLSKKYQVQSKKLKVGHSGTLDPFATGLLILAVGKATKQLQNLTGLDKTYEAEIILGKTSTTGDPEGEVSKIEDGRWNIAKSEVEEVLQQFIGGITQTPPKYSAIKINGKRAYQLAREGKEVEMPQRKVTVYSLELLDYSYPSLKIRCKVSKGTYIRTLAEDIGKMLGCGAYTKQLRRTCIGEFCVEDAIKPDSSFNEIQSHLIESGNYEK